MAHHTKLYDVMARKEEPRMNGQEIFTADSFCKHYSISRSYLTERLKAGDIAAKRIGNRIRITREEGDRWFYEGNPDYEPAA